MTRQRLRRRPDPVRTALAEARVHGLRRRHETRLANARGRELTHQCSRCTTTIRLMDFAEHRKTCPATTKSDAAEGGGPSGTTENSPEEGGR